MIPVRLRRVTRVKNFRYVLNHRSNRIHLLIIGFTGLGILTAISEILTSLLIGLAAGLDNESSGTLERGVMPSWIGETAERWGSKPFGPFWPKYTNGDGTINSAMLSFMPFSASSILLSLGLRPPIAWRCNSSPMIRSRTPRLWHNLEVRRKTRNGIAGVLEMWLLIMAAQSASFNQLLVRTPHRSGFSAHTAFATW
jgi:hypothetical protein